MFREFHTLGAATGKAREENTVVAGVCCSSKAEADRRFLVGVEAMNAHKFVFACF